MKKLAAVLISLLLICNQSFAAVGIKRNGQLIGSATDINISDSSNLTVLSTDGSTFSLMATPQTGLPAGSDTEIQFNDAGNFGASSDFTWNNSTKILGIKGDIQFQVGAAANYNINTLDQTASNTASDSISLFTGTGNGSGNGGDVNIETGNGGTNNGNAGIIYLTAGDGGATTGSGGGIELTAGSATTSGLGGNIFIEAGTSKGTNKNGGVIDFTAGDGGEVSGSGGEFNFYAGNAPLSGDAGSFVFNGGTSAGTNKDGSSFEMYLTSPTGNGDGGYLFVQRQDSPTGITAEQHLSYFDNLSFTLSSGTFLANTRVNYFIHPTINGVAGGATETVRNAATVSIEGPPVGSNVSLQNSYSLLIESGKAQAPIFASAQYMQMYAYQASARAASGAPAGSQLSITNATSVLDCGLAGGGSTFVVCVSDGTNWKSIS